MKRTILIFGGGIVIVVWLGLIVIPPFVQAARRSQQRRTMADIRAIATAWEARASDTSSYEISAKRSVTAAELAHVLEPKYIRKLPRVDAWGKEFQFTLADYDDKGHAQSYAIRSLARDGRPDRSANLSGPSTSFEDDIVYSNGSFIRYPEAAG